MVVAAAAEGGCEMRREGVRRIKRSDEAGWVRGFNICMEHIEAECTVCTSYVYSGLRSHC